MHPSAHCTTVLRMYPFTAAFVKIGLNHPRPSFYHFYLYRENKRTYFVCSADL